MLDGGLPQGCTNAAGAFEVLPAIDVRGGRVVRLERGDFERETAYDLDPVQVVRGFAAAGARWVHVVDLDGAKDGVRRQTRVIERIVEAAEGVSCEVAGGLRRAEAVGEVLRAGAARAVVGTAALRDPSFVARLVERFGPERIAVALDVRDGVAVGQGWVPGASGVPVEHALIDLAGRGARTSIVTAIERDGLLGGPDLDLLTRLVALRCGDIVASGGLASVEDVLAARQVGCSGAIVGRAIYEGRMDLAALLDAIHRA